MSYPALRQEDVALNHPVEDSTPLDLVAHLVREHAAGRHERVLQAFHAITPALLTEPALLVAVGERALESATEAGQPGDIIQVEHTLGVGGAGLGALPEAEEHFDRALTLASEQDDVRAQARALAMKGSLAKRRNDRAATRRLLTAALERYRAVGDTRGEAQSLGDLGNLADDSGELDNALRYYKGALILFRHIQDWSSVAHVHRDVKLAMHREDPSAALAHGLLSANAWGYAGNELEEDTQLWDAAGSVLEEQNHEPSSEVLGEWVGSAQEASAIREATYSLPQRHALLKLADFDPDEWERQRTFVQNPNAQTLLRRSARLRREAGDHLGALAPDAVADVLADAQEVGIRHAIDRYLKKQRALWATDEFSTSEVDALLAALSEGASSLETVDQAVGQLPLGSVSRAILQVQVAALLKSRWDEVQDPSSLIEEAIGRLEEARSSLGPNKGTLWWLNAMRDLGSAYRHRLTGDRADNHEAAVECLVRVSESHLPQAREVEILRAECQVNLANALLFRVKGDHSENVERSVSLLKSALAVLGSDRAYAPALLQNLGLAYSMRIRGERSQNEAEATSLYHKALGHTGNDEHADRGGIFFNLGLLSVRRLTGDEMANVEAGIWYLERAVADLELAGYRRDEAEARQHLALARARRQLGDPVENLRRAIADTLACIGVFESTAPGYDLGGALNNLGNLYLSLAEATEESEALSRAEAALERARRIWRRDKLPREWARATHNLANVSAVRARQGDAAATDRAVALYRQARECRAPGTVPMEWAETTRALAKTLSESGDFGPLREAERLYRAILAVPDGLVAPFDTAHAFVGLGDIAAQREDWSVAARNYSRGLEVTRLGFASAVLPRSQLQHAADTQGLFVAAAFAKGLAGDSIGAALTLEQSRARLLMEVLERDRSILTWLAAADPDLHRRYEATVQRLRQLMNLEAADVRPQFESGSHQRRRWADAEDLRADLSNLEDEIRGLPGTPSEFFGDLDPDGLLQLVADRGPILYLTLAQDSVCVAACWEGPSGLEAEFMVGPKGGALRTVEHLLSPDQPGPPDPRTSFLFAHLDPVSWGNVDIGRFCEELGREIVPGRLWAWLREVAPTRVTLIPMGVLTLAPWHAMVLPGSANPLHRCLVDFCPVRYVPSARVLRALGTSPRSLCGSVLFGNPNKGGPDSLPEAEREVYLLGERLPGSTVRVGAEATKAEIISGLQASDIFHFAGHGYYNPDRPLESGIKASDGPVMLSEVSGGSLESRFGARLVTLSACQTAVTDVLSVPDEAIGLPSAFLLAGADGVVASLWPVPDRATRELMVYFYEFLVSGSDAATALRQAQRRMRSDRPWDVSEWAGFIYIGG